MISLDHSFLGTLAFKFFPSSGFSSLSLPSPLLSTNGPGVDLGDRKHAIYALGQNGDLLEESKIRTTQKSLAQLSKKYPGAAITM